MKWFYMARNDVTRHGVADETKLAEMARNGQIGPDDLVWNCENGTQWVSASSLPGLFSRRETAGASAPDEPDMATAKAPPRVRKARMATIWVMTAALLLLVVFILAALLRR